MNHGDVPPQYRRRRTNGLGCTCDCNYARSLQGICKVLQLFILGLAWIIIAASPYYRPIFVIGGDTGPFHAVMLLSVLAWVATLGVYCMFMSGYHLSQGHRNWPKFEFWFNVGIAVVVLIAACVEAANVWRWDMSRGSVLNAGSNGAYSSYYQYGLRPGMSFTQTLNFNSYCANRPYECSDYFNLLAGNNSYYTNHLFSVVLLFFALICYLVSIYFAFRTWRVFERDMYKPGHLPKPSLWMRIQYGVETAAGNVRDKANKVLRRNRDDDDDDDEAGAVDVEEVKIKEKPDVDLEAGFEKDTSRSEGRRSRARSHHSHHSSHHGTRSHRSRSENSSRRHGERHDDDAKSSRSSSTGRSKRSSQHGNHVPAAHPNHYEEVKPVAAQPVGVLHTVVDKKKKKNSKKEKREKELEADLSPVASVLI